MSEFKKDYMQSMNSFHFSDNTKFKMAEDLCQKSLPRRKGYVMKKFVLILAAVLIFAALSGAAIHIFWSNALPETVNTSQEQRIEAEQSGLSSKPADNAQEGETVSATEEGVTVSVEQVLADMHNVEVVLAISGYEIPEGEFPDIYGFGSTLGGNEIFDSVSGAFYDGITYNENGESVYEDGTPVELDADGCLVYRFTDQEGKIRFRMNLHTQQNLDEFKGEAFNIWISNLGTGDKGQHRTDVEAKWELSWTFKGSNETRELEVNKAIGETGITLKEITLTPLEIDTVIELSEPFDGWDTLEFLNIRLEGFRTTDGTVHNNLLPIKEGYIDEDLLIASQDVAANEIIDVNSVDALIYAEYALDDGSGNNTRNEILVELN